MLTFMCILCLPRSDSALTMQSIMRCLFIVLYLVVGNICLNVAEDLASDSDKLNERCVYI